ncbi:hypothetical protein WOLCODRAFT_149621 [Wolfiporia cocos MD-104 SS10]|uniref:Uncharacterized protein n=1 Tax=Wolfiporia cocos (strain MD-104) TaxID=742152 RepID=A0A2H3JRP2_WOLCO|nr:hypothetical protein WOLCODRAFT_149621 [Wolfiporia cocos MD-104 SS10]
MFDTFLVPYYDVIGSHFWLSEQDAPSPVPISTYSEIALGNPYLYPEASEPMSQITFNSPPQLATNSSEHVRERQRVPQPLYQCRSIAPRSFIKHKILLKKHGKVGIRLADAAAGRLNNLGHGMTPVFRELDGQKASIRILWPGYMNYSKQFNIKRTRDGITIPISLNKLVQKIAKETCDFVKKTAEEHCTRPEWKIGIDHIWLEHIYLVGVVVASKGSVQPIFDVLRE